MLACNTGNKNVPVAGKDTNPQKATEKHSLAIIPFKGVDLRLVTDIQTGLRKQLDVECTTLDEVLLPDFAFYKLRQRYIADSLLVFLCSINNKRFEKVIGVTVKDIATRKGDIENWGILGLGSCPGESCVVSAFRAGRNKVGYKIFLKRMTTLSLHELGHTYGLLHCPVDTCLMKDAAGKMNLDDADVYCSGCRSQLRSKGIVK